MTRPKIKITFWRVLGVIFVVAGLYSTFIRFYKGLGASTNLSDSFPWGLWIGFDCLCGIMLAAGGFTLMATVYVFNLDKFKGIALMDTDPYIPNEANPDGSGVNWYINQSTIPDRLVTQEQ